MTRCIVHLAGSPTSTAFADLSRLYAQGCLDALRSPDSRWSEHEHRVAWVSPDGSWRFPSDLSPAAIASAPPMTIDGAVAVLCGLDVLAVLPQMFCPTGMTDHRALMQVLGLPYVGNRPGTMALTADKTLARAVVAAAGVRVPDAVVLTATDEIADLPALPVVVKPAVADNSDGVTLVRSVDDLAGAVALARRHCDRVLVESYIELGREVRCGLVHRAPRPGVDEELVALPLEEYAVDPDTKPIRGRDDKLRGDADDLALVAKDAEHAWIVSPDDPLTAAVHEAARACYAALDCRHHGLFDFRIDPEGRPWFLEAGLYCSFAPTSVVVVMARAAGISLDDLLADAVALT